MPYRYLFGPVNSRRLGRSLGVDLVPPKVCSLDCVYCESGATTTLTRARGELVPTAAVLAEIDSFLAGAPELDYVTFSGAGEPTLHSGLGLIIAHLKDNYPQYKVALITNGTLFADPAVRRAVTACDLIVPSLDAGSEQAMARINRPAPGLTAAQLIDSLVALRQEYRGQLWLEIFIVPGVNDGAGELALLRAAAARIAPDRIQLNTLDRPAPAPGVSAATREQLAAIARKFPPPVDIISRQAGGSPPGPGGADALPAAVLALLQRRPATVNDLVAGLNLTPEQAAAVLAELTAAGRVHPEARDGLLFYCAR